MKNALCTAVAASMTWSAVLAALNPNCAPGGNFDLSPWELQLPIGQPNDPETKSSSDLQGCNGYQNYTLFFTESGDGALVMKVPPFDSGCVTTTNSKHCRTEFREVDPSTGQPNSWSPSAGTNRLSATLKGVAPDNSRYGTVIGQVHVAVEGDSKPVAELYYNSTGWLNVGVEQVPDKSSENFTALEQVPVGTEFSYEIIYENDDFSVTINNGSPYHFATSQLNNPQSYFKVGNYNQGSNASDIHFFAISVQH